MVRFLLSCASAGFERGRHPPCSSSTDEADALAPATQRLRVEAEVTARETERLLTDARSTLERLRVMGRELVPAR